MGLLPSYRLICSLNWSDEEIVMKYLSLILMMVGIGVGIFIAGVVACSNLTSLQPHNEGDKAHRSSSPATLAIIRQTQSPRLSAEDWYIIVFLIIFVVAFRFVFMPSFPPYWGVVDSDYSHSSQEVVATSETRSLLGMHRQSKVRLQTVVLDAVEQAKLARQVETEEPQALEEVYMSPYLADMRHFLLAELDELVHKGAQNGEGCESFTRRIANSRPGVALGLKPLNLKKCVNLALKKKARTAHFRYPDGSDIKEAPTLARDGDAGWSMNYSNGRWLIFWRYSSWKL